MKCTEWGRFLCVTSWLFRITWCSITTFLPSRVSLPLFCLPQNYQHGRCLLAEDKISERFFLSGRTKSKLGKIRQTSKMITKTFLKWHQMQTRTSSCLAVRLRCISVCLLPYNHSMINFRLTSVQTSQSSFTEHSTLSRASGSGDRASTPCVWHQIYIYIFLLREIDSGNQSINNFINVSVRSSLHTRKLIGDIYLLVN